MESIMICSSIFCLTVSCIYFTEVSTWLRKKIHKNVKCWFCHVVSRVRYIDSNCWTCSSCGQYNGFSKDGGYNRDIPNQHDDRLNFAASTFSRSKSEFKRFNTLCSQCNYNQELKIKQLAAFVPISEANYDKEIQHFKLQLEESYKLCPKCEDVVSNVISSEKYITAGPRRLAQLTRKLVFKSYWSLYASMMLSLLTAANRLLTVMKPPSTSIPWIDSASLNFSHPLTIQILAGLGVVLHTLQCCQFGTLWSFVNWLVWAIMASTPHFLQNQQLKHICYIQCVISISLLTSTFILILRRKRIESSLKHNDDLRKERRKKEDLSATWTSLNHNPSGPDKSFAGNKKRSSPVKLSPQPGMKTSDKANVLKPVARIPEPQPKKDDLDISSLSISSKADYSYGKCSSPWDREPVTRSSSFSSGISSLRSSPCSWKTSQNWYGSQDNNLFKNQTPPAPHDSEWGTKSSIIRESNFRKKNDSWSTMSAFDYERPDWEIKKSPWPTQIYPYPVAYAWSNVSPSVASSWDRSSTAMMPSPSISQETIREDKSNSTILSALPTIILAATNACLVYYILNSKT